MLVTLDKVQAKICPEKYFDDQVKRLLDIIISRRKCSVKHRSDAGVADEEEDEDVEDGLPFIVGINDNPFFTCFLLILDFKIRFICLIFTGQPVNWRVRAS